SYSSSAAAGVRAGAVTGSSACLTRAVTGRSARLSSNAGRADGPRTLPSGLAVGRRVAARRAAIPVRSRPILVGRAAAVLRLMLPPVTDRGIAVDVRVPVEIVVVVHIDVVVSPAGIPAPSAAPRRTHRGADAKRDGRASRIRAHWRVINRRIRIYRW